MTTDLEPDMLAREGAFFSLQGNDTLFASGLSDAHMEVLLDLLHPLKLGTPKMQLDPFPRLGKPGRKASGKKCRRLH